ncbi:MAG: hypothetical protein KDD35_02125 [Bdellovibrionales bacterium]|nr:hypothetical protein [Bdellovibrionales bacterium]
MSSRTELRELITALANSDFHPGNIQMSRLGVTNYVTCEMAPSESIISENYTCGMDINIFTATIKAIVEHVERKSLLYNRNNNKECSLVSRSDGLAAYPVSSRSGIEYAHRKARDNALCEAVERYIWASWWDNSEFCHRMYPLVSYLKDDFECLSLMRFLGKSMPIDSASVIFPEIKGDDFVVLVVLIRLKKLGYVSGGSCSFVGDRSNLLRRALYEAARHFLGLKKAIEGGMSPTTFYEQRLLFFGSGSANQIVDSRLSSGGGLGVVLPKLQFDEILSHPFDEIVACHRCYFENQPPFIGGPLERLCL